MGGDNPFGANSEFEKSDGTMARFMDLHSLEEEGLCKLEEIPFSIRILLELSLIHI